MDFAKLIEWLFDEYADFDAAEDKRAHCVTRAGELYEQFVKPIDLPGPDWAIDPFMAKMVEFAAGSIYDAISERFASEDGIDLIVGAEAPTGRFRLNRQKRRELGLTIPAMFRELAAWKADGDLEQLDTADLPQRLIDRLMAKNPKLAAEAEIDPEFWAKLLEWVKFILPFLLIFI